MATLAAKFNRTAWGGLVLVLALRVGLQLALLQAGFLALTADEFARMLLAARWSQTPFAAWQGVWLPFHMYLYGAALRLTALAKGGDLWQIGRLLAGTFGLISLVLMFLLTWRLLGSLRAAWISALLLAVNPVHLWLSATPLTEIFYLTFLLGAVLGLVLFWQKEQWRYLYLASGSLLLASGFRYEAWLAAAVFSLIIVLWSVRLNRRRTLAAAQALKLLAAAGLPWLFPLLWIAGNAAANGDPFYFLHEIAAYKRTWYGAAGSFQPYLAALLKIDSLALILAWPGLALLLVQRRDEPALRGYTALAVVPLVLFLSLQAGQPEPPANYLRYLAGYLYLLLPAAVYLLEELVQRLTLRPALQNGLLLLAVGSVATLQLGAAFQFTNDPAAAGLEVGRQIQGFQQEVLQPERRGVVLELRYWDYLAIRTGANEPPDLLYDRALDPNHRAAASLLIEDPLTFVACLAAQRVGLVVVHSSHLRQFLETNWRWQPAQTVNDYAFYPVPADWLVEKYARLSLESQHCPLKYSYHR